jgi:membrane protease YdiL (CAAX protease family)
LITLFGIAGLIEVFGRPLRPEDLRRWELLGKYQESLPGWIALTTLLALVIPFVEEFNFRGRIQHALERKYGLPLAIAVTSVLFAVSHIGVPRSAILLIPLTLSVANGIAANLFRSIWVPVAIHALWNGTLALLGRLNADSRSTYGAMDHGAILVLSCVLIALGLSGWLYLLHSARRRRAIQPAE